MATREEALATVEQVEALIAKARDAGLDTLYFEIVPTVARVALEVRWDLPGHEEKREGYAAWVCEHASKLKEHLEAVLAGKGRALTVPPIPDYGELELRDGYLRHKGEPLLLFGVHGRGPRNLVGRYFAPGDLMGFVSGVGGTRFDYHEQPIWETYQKYPDTHRVWAGGPWCGHIIVDQWSIGGRSKGDCIICLESPRTREAVVEYMKKKVPGLRDNPRVKFYSLDWEYAYICFCEQTLEMWRRWVAEKHKTVEALNEVWGTEFRSFVEVTLPPIETEKEENRAKWYDFARFNCWRFTDYMLWARSQLRRVDPAGLTCTGAPFYMLAGQMGWAGIDEEALDRTVNDVVLNEAHGSTVTTDLLASFPTEPKLLQDPEYHGDIAHILAHFLHGDGYISMWWWPETLRPNPPSFYASDIGRSPRIRLEDVATCLRSALDARRLSPSIVRFHRQQSEVALLYAHDSMLQLAPELRNSRNVPHVFALRTLYDGTVYLDAPTRFVTERQIAEGRLQSLKLLVLPGVEYQNRATQSGILDWVRGGGTLVLSPNSWLADEYARPADYLSSLGVRIEAMVLPEVRVSEARPDVERATGFIMGAISEVELEKVPKSELQETSDWPFGRRGGAASLGVLPPASQVHVPPEGAGPEGAKTRRAGSGLVGWGVQHTVAVANPKASAIATFADGRPAILRIPVGKGTVYYFATPLVAESWHRFFDALYDGLGVTRLTRTLDAGGGNFFGIDSRTVAVDGGYLTYVINLLREAQEVTLLLPAGVSRATNLSAEEPVAVPKDGRLTLSLGRFETVLLRLT